MDHAAFALATREVFVALAAVAALAAVLASRTTRAGASSEALAPPAGSPPEAR
jgi:hypothetical protein